MSNPFETATFIRARISLRGIEPEIWRIIEVDSGLHLDQFHEVLQIAMGWQQCHLHTFSSFDRRQPRDPRQSEPRVWLSEFLREDDPEGLPEADAILGEALTHTSGPLYYEYDLGDCWTHLIEFGEYLSVEPTDPPARVIDGARACPPEDCGGSSGYDDLLAKLMDPLPEVRLPAELWANDMVGPWRDFEPGFLDLEAINTELRSRFGSIAPTGKRPSAISTFTRRLPPGYRTEFQTHLKAKGVFEPVAVDRDAAERIVRPYEWLISRVGPDGVALSKAGWLPPAVVSDAMRELGWADEWIGKMNREDLTFPVAELRQSAQRLGLLRKHKGTLRLTRAAEAVLDDPIGLLGLIAAGLARSQPEMWLQDAALLIAIEVSGSDHEHPEGYLIPVADGLNLLGHQFEEGVRIEPEDLDYELLDILSGLTRLNAFEAGAGMISHAPPGPDGRLLARMMLNS